jgi:hypothetical protein
MSPAQLAREIRWHRTAFRLMVVMLVVANVVGYAIYWPFGVVETAVGLMAWVTRGERQTGVDLAAAAQRKQRQDQDVRAGLEKILREAHIPFGK